MSFNAKEAADKLFKIADAIEKQASEKTFFVCESCNHTANLASINGARAKFASDNKIESVASVSVDDTVTCKACGGDMKYAATEESEKFFVEAASKKSEDEEGVEIFDETTEEVSKEPADDADKPEESEESDKPLEDVEEVEESEEKEEEEPKKKKRTTKDKEDTDGKAEMKEEPKAQFGDEEKKSSKTAFDVAVDRYSNL